MKINLKVRMKNPCFWINIALALIVPIFGYFGLTAADITSWSKLSETFMAAIMNPYVLLLAATSVWNELHNPTVSGYSDDTEIMKLGSTNSKE